MILCPNSSDEFELKFPELSRVEPNVGHNVELKSNFPVFGLYHDYNQFYDNFYEFKSVEQYVSLEFNTSLCTYIV